MAPANSSYTNPQIATTNTLRYNALARTAGSGGSVAADGG